MPKTIINYPSYSEPFGLAFSIHWDNASPASGGAAQLSVQFTVAELREHLQKLEKDSPGDVRSIIYSEALERDELQKLIVSTRRARDAVFGADE